MNLVFKNEECRREFMSTDLNRLIVIDYYDATLGFSVCEPTPYFFTSLIDGAALIMGNEINLFKEYVEEECIVKHRELLLLESLKYLPTDTSDSQDLRNKIKKFLQS